MFDNMTAFIVSPTREGHWRLVELADRAGFARCVQYKNIHILSQACVTQQPFCLIEGATPLPKLKEIVGDIRKSSELDLAYMPIVVLTAKVSATFIETCVQQGCDDIISLPCKAIDFSRRMKRQVETQLDYFRTTTYFGPDRRRAGVYIEDNEKRKPIGSDFEKMVITRHRRSGVKLISHEHYTADGVLKSA